MGYHAATVHPPKMHPSAEYTENHEEYEKNMLRLNRKFDTATKYTPKPIITGDKKAKVGIISLGTTHYAVVEARDMLDAKKISTKYMRVLSYPFHQEVKDFIDSCDKVVVIEANRDGQLAGLLTQAYKGSDQKVVCGAFSDGLPMDPVRITTTIAEVA